MVEITPVDGGGGGGRERGTQSLCEYVTGKRKITAAPRQAHGGYPRSAFGRGAMGILPKL